MGVIILICFLDITTSIFMESPGTLVSTECETDLDKSACAGYCFFYSPMLEDDFASALPTAPIRSLALKDSS